MNTSDQMHLQTALKQTRKQELLQMCLAAIAGYIDAFGLIRFKTYLSFMSGNTTQTGNLFAKGDLRDATFAIIAISSFFAGVFLGNVARQFKYYKVQWMSFIPVAAGLVLFLLCDSFFALKMPMAIFIIAISMGYMNTIASMVGRQPVNADFVTGTLNNMAKHLALSVFEKYPSDRQGNWDTHIRRYFLLLFTWGGFISGAIGGTLIFQHWANRSLLIPISILIALAVNGLFQNRSKTKSR